MKYIFLLCVGVAVVTLFQNCGGTDAAVKFSSSQETNIEVDENLNGQEQLDNVNQPTWVVQGTGLTHVEKVDPFQPELAPLEIILLLDESQSNAPFASKVADGVRSLIQHIPDNVLYLKTYNIGNVKNSKSNPYRVFRYENFNEELTPEEQTIASLKRTSVGAINAPLAELTPEDLQGLSAEEKQQAKNDFIQKVQSHLNQFTTGVYRDSRPTLYCETLALLVERAKSDASKRTVIVAATDEDGSNWEKAGCYKEKSLLRQFRGLRSRTRVKLERQYDHEVGGAGWYSTMVTVSGDSNFNCSNVTQSFLTEFLSSRSYFRQASDSLSSCVHSSYNHYDVVRQEKSSWTNQKPLPLVTEEIKDVLSSDGMGQVYFGLFSLLSEAEKLNSDQEVAQNLQSFVQEILPASNYTLSSLTQSNYADFINGVIDFKRNTEVNKMSIASLIDDMPSESRVNVTHVQVRAISTNILYQVKNFSQQGSDLLISDLRVNLSEGAEVMITYELLTKN